MANRPSSTKLPAGRVLAYFYKTWWIFLYNYWRPPLYGPFLSCVQNLGALDVILTLQKVLSSLYIIVCTNIWWHWIAISIQQQFFFNFLVFWHKFSWPFSGIIFSSQIFPVNVTLWCWGPVNVWCSIKTKYQIVQEGERTLILCRKSSRILNLRSRDNFVMLKKSHV